MKFELTILTILYVLDPNLQPILKPNPQDTDIVKA